MKSMPILEEVRTQIEAQVSAVLKKIEKNRKVKTHPDLEGYVIRKIKKELAELLKDKLAVNPSDFDLEIPPPHITADLGFSVFDIAKKLKVEPAGCVSRIASAIHEVELETVQNVSAEGPFVNVNLRSEKVYGEILSNVHDIGGRYGESDEFSGKVAYVDYSHPNIAKPIGVGNTRSTIIGEAIGRLYEAVGYSVIRDNFIGDWGAQFGKLIYAYRTWGNDEDLKHGPLSTLKKWYVEFHKKEEEDPELSEKAALLAGRLEKGDEEFLGIWKRFRDLSIKGFEATYKRLGIKFDTYLSESFFVDKANDAIKDCLDKHICNIDGTTGAVFVEAFPELPSFILRKGDSSTLYMARDLAAMKFRVETFRPDVLMFVVGGEQSLNFKQLFALSKKMGYIKNVTVKHIDFGLVLLEGRKMATRRGTAVELEDVLNQAAARAKEIMEKKNPSLAADELEEISEMVGVGSVVYGNLRQSREKNVEFNLERMLDFEGGSAAYLQYTCVRIQSILRQAKDLPETKSFKFESPVEFILAKKLMFFPEVVLAAARNDSPHLIATYLEELAQQFNSFYGMVSVIGTKEDDLRRSRLGLVAAVAQVIKNGLSILNIRVPERM